MKHLRPAIKRLRAIWLRIRYGRCVRSAYLVLFAVRRQRCPMVSKAGFPTVAHRENLACELPERDEEWLSEVADELWPDEEYAEFVRDPPEGRPS